MATDAGGRWRSPLVGDLRLPPGPPPEGGGGSAGGGSPDVDPHEPVVVLLELNTAYPGGRDAVTRDFHVLWQQHGPAEQEPAQVTAKLLQCVLSRAELQGLVAADRAAARAAGRTPVVFKAWPDYLLHAQTDRSAPTVKADAAWRSYNALGRGVLWAVVDSGIDGTHPHFSALELAVEAGAVPGPPPIRSAGLHHDFTAFVKLPGDAAAQAGPVPAAPLADAQGHGTHVAGIISGRTPSGLAPHVAASDEPPGGGGFVQRSRVEVLSGMAPECELVSLKVLRRSAQGVWVTSSAAVIAALEYLRTEVNVDPGLLRVHGVNISLGCSWDPTHYAAGQSPLSQAVNQLVDAGVVVVVSAGNGGGSQDSGGDGSHAVLGTITEPAHAEGCIAVGSTHREAPHAFGVSWTSGKGPTLDGRLKPDVVAPGEWITSAATGAVRSRAGLDGLPPGEQPHLTYAELSGTSMAAPHVSGVVAAFLSARPEFIGRPHEVKRLLMDSATDLGRERYAQGAGVVDLMRMLSNS